MNNKLIIAILIVGLSLLTFSLIKAFPGALNDKSDQIHLVSALAILSYLVVTLASKRLEVSKAFQYFLIWLGIGLVLLVGYTFKGEIFVVKDRLAQQLLPSSPHKINDESVSFTTTEKGHFYVDGKINGTEIHFLVDSGASVVVLTRRDAERAGISLNELDFIQPTQTANGQVFSAPIMIPRLEVGSIVVDNVPASVSRSELTQSLLGMSFLSRLKSWRVEGDRLILEK
jgi:aspartyl protease family protein